MNKPSIPVNYDRTRHGKCPYCEEWTKHKTHPWVITRMRGGDNIARRKICLSCNEWWDEHKTAPVVWTDVPTKRLYDEYYNDLDLKKAILEQKEEQNHVR